MYTITIKSCKSKKSNYLMYKTTIRSCKSINSIMDRVVVLPVRKREKKPHELLLAFSHMHIFCFLCIYLFLNAVFYLATFQDWLIKFKLSLWLHVHWTNLNKKFHASFDFSWFSGSERECLKFLKNHTISIISPLEWSIASFEQTSTLFLKDAQCKVRLERFLKVKHLADMQADDELWYRKKPNQK